MQKISTFCHLRISSTENSGAICLNQSHISPHYYNDSSKVYFALLFKKKEHSYLRKAASKRDVPSVLTFVFLLNQIGFHNRLLFSPQKEKVKKKEVKKFQFKDGPTYFFLVFSNRKRVGVWFVFFPARALLVDLSARCTSMEQLPLLCSDCGSPTPLPGSALGGCGPWRHHIHKRIEQPHQLLLWSNAAALTTMRFEV